MTKMIPALKNYSYPRRLQELHLTTLQERHTRQDIITVYTMFNGNIGMDPDKYFKMEDRHRTRGNVRKMKPRYTRLEVRRNTSFERVRKDWNKLPDIAVTAPTLLAFEKNIEKKGSSRARASYP